MKQQLVSFVFLELAFDRLMFALNLKQDNIKSKRSKRTILQLLTTTLLSSMYLKLAFSGFGTYKRKMVWSSGTSFLRLLSRLKSNWGLTAASFIDKNCKTEKWKIDFGLLQIQWVWTVQSPKFSEDNNSEPLQDVDVPNVTIEIVGSHSAKTEQFAINSLFEVPSRF